jgi:hypothetical protein
MLPHETLTTIILAIVGSGGFWTLLQFIVTKLTEKRTASSKMLLGLGHERILEQCAFYKLRGYITPDEYTEFERYLYKPYIQLGGNGAVEREMQRVKALPSEPPKEVQNETT